MHQNPLFMRKFNLSPFCCKQANWNSTFTDVVQVYPYKQRLVCVQDSNQSHRFSKLFWTWIFPYPAKNHQLQLSLSLSFNLICVVVCMIWMIYLVFWNERVSCIFVSPSHTTCSLLLRTSAANNLRKRSRILQRFLQVLGDYNPWFRLHAAPSLVCSRLPLLAARFQSSRLRLDRHHQSKGSKNTQPHFLKSCKNPSFMSSRIRLFIWCFD